MYRFLWDSKPSKVSRYTIEHRKEEGGLAMINIRNYLTGLKLSWLKRMRTNKEFEKRVLNFYPMLKNLEKMGGDVSNVFLTIKGFNPFWENIVQSWADKGILKIGNLLDDNSNFYATRNLKTNIT